MIKYSTLLNSSQIFEVTTYSRSKMLIRSLTGFVVSELELKKGSNSAIAPVNTGVYLISITDENGRNNSGKIIVR